MSLPTRRYPPRSRRPLRVPPSVLQPHRAPISCRSRQGQSAPRPPTPARHLLHRQLASVAPVAPVAPVAGRPLWQDVHARFKGHLDAACSPLGGRCARAA
jgi:hypothetical protein